MNRKDLETINKCLERLLREGDIISSLVYGGKLSKYVLKRDLTEEEREKLK